MQGPYDPVGALGGLFAPAYIHGNPQSEDAVAAWMKAHYSVTPDIINASRLPGTGGNPGPVDPNALIAAAQGGTYDPSARRDAIAAQVQAQQQAAAAPSTPVYPNSPYPGWVPYDMGLAPYSPGS